MSIDRPAAGPRRREQVRDFLRTRRARLTPADVGVAAGARRRTPGLRREEVALLAGVGVSWYTWLEQGRDIKPSTDVLDAIARALQLSGPERTHLHLLCGLNPPRDNAVRGGVVPEELRRLLDAWAPGPAVLRDRHRRLLAVNNPARSLFGYRDDDENCLFVFFTNDRYRRLDARWEAAAPAVVAAFRADAAHAPDDPEFGRVVAALSAVSPEFAALWARHDVAVPAQAVKAVHHESAGELVFDMTTLTVADRPDWFVELYQPHPGTGTAEYVAGPRVVVATPG